MTDSSNPGATGTPQPGATAGGNASAATPAPAAAPSPSPAPAPTPAPAPSPAPAPEGSDAQLLFDKNKQEGADKGEGDKGEKKEGEGEAKPKEGEAAATTYTDFKIPENLPAPAEALEQFKTFAAENKLTQEAAQKLLDMHVETQRRMYDEFAQITADWKKQTEQHPKIGGANLPATIGKVNDLIRNNATSPEHLGRVQDVLQSMGLGNNPDIIELFHNIAEKTREDSLAGSGSSSSTTKAPLEERLWPNMVKK